MAFDPDTFLQTPSSQGFDPDKVLRGEEPPVPLPRPRPRGAAEAFGRGAASGATAGFYDELRGLGEAGGIEPEKPLGWSGIAKGAYNVLTGDEEARKKLEETSARERSALEQSRTQQPVATGVGEFTGAVAGMSALPGAGVVKGAGVVPNLGRGAILGGEYGALSGAGEAEGTTERAIGAGTGAVTGAVGGAGGSALASGAGYVLNRFGKPVLSTIRGWAQPEAEAGRRIAGALAEDMVDIASGKANGLSLSEWQAARARGEPVTLADLGAGKTQALLRSAANTSPEGRAIIEKVLNDRFEGQGERLAADIRKLSGGNAAKTRDQLVAEYDLERTPAYQKAFSNPNAQSMWNEGFEQISQAPVVQQAIRGAMVNGRNEAAKMGLTPPKNPFVQDASGRLVLDPESNLKPSLQFWDVVKKNLDAIGSSESRFWSKTLRDHIDPHVPEYADARGIAAKFFNERDALDAGRAAAGQRMDPADLSKVVRSMSPAERDLFREGWADAWRNKVLEVRDRADVTGRTFESPNERARAAIVFGPQNLSQIEARLTLEKIFDGARKAALGNSTTTRQLIESGLAGGLAGGAIGGWDWQHIAGGAGVGATAGHFAGQQLASGAKQFVGYVDKNTARHVAELLVSDDPQKLAQGLRVALRNHRIMSGLNDIAQALSVRTGTTLPEKKLKGMLKEAFPEQRYGGRVNRQTGGRVVSQVPPGARMAPDGKFYLQDPNRPGRYLRVDP